MHAVRCHSAIDEPRDYREIQEQPQTGLYRDWSLPDRFGTAAISQPPAIGNRHHDQDFVSKRVGNGHRDGVENARNDQ
jgi:hypothetical protein